MAHPENGPGGAGERIADIKTSVRRVREILAARRRRLTDRKDPRPRPQQGA